MFNKKEIKELQDQVKALQAIPSIDEGLDSLATHVVRLHSANQITMTYQEERIQVLENKVEKLESLIKRITGYVGMTEGHLR